MVDLCFFSLACGVYVCMVVCDKGNCVLQTVCVSRVANCVFIVVCCVMCVDWCVCCINVCD